MSSERPLSKHACWWHLIAMLIAFLAVACVQVDDQRGGSAPAQATAALGGVVGVDPEAGGAIGDPDGALLATPVLPTASATATLSPDESPRLDGTADAPTRPAPEPTETVPLAVVVTPTPGAEPTEVVATDSPVAEADTADPASQPTAAPTLPPSHVVAPGETLYQIGVRYGLPWTAIAALNGIVNPDQIVVGQALVLPAATAAAQGPPAEAGTPPPVDQPTAAPEATAGPVSTHTVRPGDNVYRLSQLYGVSWVEIAEANGLITPNQIYVGQVLKIPVSRPGPTPEFTHQVRGGESLFRIALQYGVPLPALVEANGLQAPYVIYPGQTLVIPTGDDD